MEKELKPIFRVKGAVFKTFKKDEIESGLSETGFVDDMLSIAEIEARKEFDKINSNYEFEITDVKKETRVGRTSDDFIMNNISVIFECFIFYSPINP